MGNLDRFDQYINDIVKNKKTIRTFSNEEVGDEIITKLDEYIRDIKGPFNDSVTLKILDSKEKVNGAKLGTYGVIKGADKYIAAKVKDSKYSLEELGYEMEALMLYASSLGLGTCCMGGKFKKGEFAKALEVEEGEFIPVISPLGYGAEKSSLMDKVISRFSKENKRKAWHEIFFLRDFTCPLTEHCTLDEYKDALENLRLAQSAVNKQPWRIVKSGNAFHFFVAKEKNEDEEVDHDIRRVDMGVAMANFDLTCKQKGLKGEFKVVNHNIPEVPKDITYLISWVKG